VGARFSAPIQNSPGYNGYRVFLGGELAGAWRWPPTPFSTEFFLHHWWYSKLLLQASLVAPGLKFLRSLFHIHKLYVRMTVHLW